jgi:hypothetical protein
MGPKWGDYNLSISKTAGSIAFATNEDYASNKYSSSLYKFKPTGRRFTVTNTFGICNRLLLLIRMYTFDMHVNFLNGDRDKSPIYKH